MWCVWERAQQRQVKQQEQMVGQEIDKIRQISWQNIQGKGSGVAKATTGEMVVDCWYSWNSWIWLYCLTVWTACLPQHERTWSMATSGKISGWHLIKYVATTVGALPQLFREWSTTFFPCARQFARSVWMSKHICVGSKINLKQRGGQRSSLCRAEKISRQEQVKKKQQEERKKNPKNIRTERRTWRVGGLDSCTENEWTVKPCFSSSATYSWFVTPL